MARYYGVVYILFVFVLKHCCAFRHSSRDMVNHIISGEVLTAVDADVIVQHRKSAAHEDDRSPQEAAVPPSVGEVQLDVIEVAPDTVTLELHCKETQQFNLQWRESSADAWTDVGGEGRLLGVSVRKKGLSPGGSFLFRARGKRADGSFTDWGQPVSVIAPTAALGKAPVVRSVMAQEGTDKLFVATLEWDKVQDAEKYEVQLRTVRSGLEPEWRTMSAALKAPIVRKKNLSPAPDYIFRARAITNGSWGGWTAVTGQVQIGGLAPLFSKLFGNQLLRRDPSGRTTRTVVTSDELAGKVVLVYFSAGWCGHCVEQTKMMKQPEMYPSWKQKGLPVEIVFVSGDRDASGFENYWQQMPWLAMPYSQRCQEIMGMYKVQGIPRLMVFSPSGNVVAENVPAKVPLTEQVVRSWMAHP